MGLVPSKVYPPVSWREFPAAESVFPPCPRALRMGTGSGLAAPWRCLVFFPGLNCPRCQLSHVAGTPVFLPERGKSEPAGAAPGCRLHLAVLSRPDASVCSPGKRGEEQCLPPLPTIPHKHFRAMQGRKLCLAFFPTPLATFPHSYSLSPEGIFHFCFQTLSGSNWNKSKTDKAV